MKLANINVSGHCEVHGRPADYMEDGRGHCGGGQLESPRILLQAGLR